MSFVARERELVSVRRFATDRAATLDRAVGGPTTARDLERERRRADGEERLLGEETRSRRDHGSRRTLGAAEEIAILPFDVFARVLGHVVGTGSSRFRPRRAPDRDRRVERVVEAAVQRSRPVVLTALAAVLAFVPLTQDSFWGPLAYVLIGGVAVGTAITLLFVPALYAVWFRIKAT